MYEIFFCIEDKFGVKKIKFDEFEPAQSYARYLSKKANVKFVRLFKKGELIGVFN